MPRYAQGQPVTVSTTVRAETSPGVYAMVDPDTIVLRVRTPAGVQLPDLTPTRDGLGEYHHDLNPVDLPDLGLYAYAWVTTGPGQGVSPPAAFSVVDPFAPTHLSLQDARARVLNSRGTAWNPDRDDELQDMIASAVAEQEHRVGAVAPRTVTETITASGGRLWPRRQPVLSVISATVAGSPVDVTDWDVAEGAVIGAPVRLSGRYVVTYVAGRNPVPQDLVEAALLRVQHSYETQRGPAELPLTDSVEGGGAAFLLMLRARDKEAPYLLPAIA